MDEDEYARLQDETTKANADWTSKQTKMFSDMANSTNTTFNAFSLNMNAIAGEINNTFSSLIDAMNPLDSDAFKAMDEYGTKIQRTFGLAKNRMDEFKDTIANAGPELIKMGLTESDITTNMTSIMEGLGTTASVTEDAIIEVTAAAEVTGQQVGTLAENFRGVGVSIYDVGEEMKKVTDYARSVGVSVKGVSEGVVSNLAKINTFNFENGVVGLAKMAATSERLGISMDKVFQTAEDLLSPEKAIDMSSALQRLGVTSSGLLDPLRAMDMAQNDPEALQKEMVKLGQEFTTFNEKTGKMEILPGAKRRMREVASAVGMTAEEFSKMALKSADFEMKLKQIKMPDIVGGNQETKELIASMAQMKDGVATIKVKDSETGKIEEKKVEELTPDDIKELQKANEESSKSIEDIAMNQLDETKQIKNLLESGVVATKFAKATTPTLSKFYGQVSSAYKNIAKSTADVIGTTQQQRKAQESIYQPVSGIVQGGLSGDKEMMVKSTKELDENIFKTLGDFETRFQTSVNETQMKIVQDIQTAYSKPLKVEAKADSNINIGLNVSGANLTSADIDKIKQAMLNDPTFATQLNKILAGGTVSASTGGKNT
jgi:hypothetical protein